MAKQSRSAPRRKSGGNLNDEIQATRVIWNDGVASMAPSWEAFASDLRALARNMFNSPLGERAQRHPVAALSATSIAAVVLLRLLRR